MRGISRANSGFASSGLRVAVSRPPGRQSHAAAPAEPSALRFHLRFQPDRQQHGSCIACALSTAGTCSTSAPRRRPHAAGGQGARRMRACGAFALSFNGFSHRDSSDFNLLCTRAFRKRGRVKPKAKRLKLRGTVCVPPTEGERGWKNRLRADDSRTLRSAGQQSSANQGTTPRHIRTRRARRTEAGQGVFSGGTRRKEEREPRPSLSEELKGTHQLALTSQRASRNLLGEVHPRTLTLNDWAFRPARRKRGCFRSVRRCSGRSGWP